MRLQLWINVAVWVVLVLGATVGAALLASLLACWWGRQR